MPTAAPSLPKTASPSTIYLPHTPGRSTPGNVEALVACFTPDAVVIEEVFEEPDRWEGHENIRRFAEHFRNVPNFPGRQHHITQSIVSGDSERCAVRSFALVTECRGEPPYVIRFAGILG